MIMRLLILLLINTSAICFNIDQYISSNDINRKVINIAWSNKYNLITSSQEKKGISIFTIVITIIIFVVIIVIMIITIITS